MPARRSPWMDQDLDDFRDLARTFCEKEIQPHIGRFIENRHVDRDLWNKAGSLGLLCASVPEEYGGGGGTFAHETILIEEQAAAGDSSFGAGLHSGIVAHYLLAYGTEEQAPLAAQDGERRGGHRHRDDRAGHRFGPASDPDQGHPRRRRLCRERHQDVHHQRRSG